MTDQEVRAIALFFYYSLLDDKKVIEATSLAVSNFNEKKRKHPDMAWQVLVISSTYELWNKNLHKISRGRPNIHPDSGWQIPKDVQLGPWKEFQKTSSQDELLTLIWSKILGFSDQQIAVALQISEGTVRYRLARALRKVGALCQPARLKNV